MKSEPSAPHSDLMVLLSIISGAMCGLPVTLRIKLLLIATMVPELGWLVQRWLDVEESSPECWLWEATGRAGEADDPGDAAEAEVCSGWVRQTGAVWLWRNVSKAGVLICPVRVYAMMRSNLRQPHLRQWTPRPAMVAAFSNFVFLLVLG